ncbi:MAG TPA: hypothetical protein VMO20_09995, partial [Candidatus Acidoferrum sp.]|nr:hypothetical protein [Candidatus Acidoferrum sp.]
CISCFGFYFAFPRKNDPAALDCGQPVMRRSCRHFLNLFSLSPGGDDCAQPYHKPLPFGSKEQDMTYLDEDFKNDSINHLY